jgi:hypothetical protein
MGYLSSFFGLLKHLARIVRPHHLAKPPLLFSFRAHCQLVINSALMFLNIVQSRFVHVVIHNEHRSRGDT